MPYNHNFIDHSVKLTLFIANSLFDLQPDLFNFFEMHH